MQFVDDRGFANAGISGDQHQLRPTALDASIERGKQGADLAFTPVQLLGNQQPVGDFAFAQRVGCSAAGSTASTEPSALAWLPTPQKTRSPSSNKAWKFGTPICEQSRCIQLPCSTVERLTNSR
jgi:hypothetical protein